MARADKINKNNKTNLFFLDSRFRGNDKNKQNTKAGMPAREWIKVMAKARSQSIFLLFIREEKERKIKEIRKILARCCGVVKKKEKRVKRPAKMAENQAAGLEKLFLISVR